MKNTVHIQNDEASYQSFYTEEQSIKFTNSTREIELTGTQLEAIYGAQGHSSAPVSDFCLQSILLGVGHCQ